MLWIWNNKIYAMKIFNLNYLEDIVNTQKKLDIILDFSKWKITGIIKTYLNFADIHSKEYIYYQLLYLDYYKKIYNLQINALLMIFLLLTNYHSFLKFYFFQLLYFIWGLLFNIQ